MIEEIKVIPTTNFPPAKRFLFSALRVFGAGFVLYLAQTLVLLHTPITWAVIQSLIMGALSAGLTSFAKYLQEKQSGVI